MKNFNKKQDESFKVYNALNKNLNYGEFYLKFQGECYCFYMGQANQVLFSTKAVGWRGAAFCLTF